MSNQRTITDDDRRQMEEMYLQGQSLSAIAAHFSLSVTACREQLEVARRTWWSDAGEFTLTMLEHYDRLEGEVALVIPKCSGKKRREYEDISSKVLADRVSMIQVMQTRRADPSQYPLMNDADKLYRKFREDEPTN